MNEHTYNHQTINQYLLGALPEAEGERLDELSFTDDEFSDSLRAAEKDLVDAYVRGELSGADLENFKSHYLASPIRRAQVEFAQAFQTFAEREVAVIQAEPTRSGAPKPGWFASMSAFFAPRPVLQWGLATIAIMLVVGGGLLVFQNVRLRQQVSQSQARDNELRQRQQELQNEIEAQRAANAKAEQELAQARAEHERLASGPKQPSSPSGILSLILTPQLRGAGQIPSVSIQADTAYLAAQLRLDPNDFTAYRAVLISQSTNQPVWRSGTLRAKATGDGKSLSLKLPANLLKPGPYLIRVSGPAMNASETVGDYPFRVVK